jgi:Niemann-Pick C1 protein
LKNWTIFKSEIISSRVPFLGDLARIRQYLEENDSEESSGSSESDDERDQSVTLDPTLFCGIVNSFKQGCLQLNILDMWRRNSTESSNLTLANVIAKLNHTKISPVTGHVTDFSSMLGRTQRDASGVIVSAKAVTLTWLLSVDLSKIRQPDHEIFVGGDDWATENVLAWELAFNTELEKLQQILTAPDFAVTFSAQRSNGDAKLEFINAAKTRLAISALLMFIFIQIVLSKCNWVELRLVVGVATLVSIGMGLVTGFGMGALIGFELGPIHGSIPYLALGLGVDDMFVIMSIFKVEQLRSGEAPLTQLIGATLKKAGASITITSVTDIVVLVVGSSTVIPGLRSFCVYAAFSILMVYIYVVTFFVAILVLDERRISKKRNALIPCIVHKNHNPSTSVDPKVKVIGFVHHFLVAPVAGKVRNLLDLHFQLPP